MLCAVAATSVRAQGPAVPAVGKPAEAVKEHERIHLREKDGTLVPVFGYSYADFEELINLKNQIGRGQIRPRYTMQRFAGAGVVTGQFARLDVELEVLVSATGWVRVPLRLPEAALLETPKYKGPTRYFTDFDGATGGYAAYFYGNGEQPHSLTLALLVPVERLPGKQRLKLTAPRSAQSELKLSVPLAEAEADVTGGALLDTTAPRAGAQGSTSLTLRSLDGESDLTWWPATRQAVETTPDLEASGILLSKVDGRSVRTEATFTVRSSSGEFRFDSFRIRLPRGANLSATDQPGVRFSGPTNVNGGRVVDVTLDAPTSDPVEVRIATERPFNIAKKDELVELAGFEVVDALRQWGYIGVEVAEEWQISLAEKHPGVRQMETLPEALRQANLVAGFEYSGQPCSLQARVFARETRIAVEPEYEVRVEATRMFLKARLKYRVPGTKIFFVNVDLRGWETEADRVGPPNLVDQDQLAPQLLTPLTIPLEQPLKGEFELTLEAWKPIPRDAKTIDLHLPHPTAHNLVTSQAVIVPADNVQLLPQADGLTNLKSQPLPRKFHVPGRQQEPLFYLGDETQGRFVADFRVLPRVITVASATTINLGQRESQVEQKLSYKVAHEPIDRLTFEVPSALADSKGIAVSLAGRSLPLAVLPEAAPQPLGALKMYAALVDEAGKPLERIGSFEVLVRYAVPHDPLVPEANVSLEVPVLVPLDGELTGNQASVVASPGLKAVYRHGAWSPASPLADRLDQMAGLQLSAKERLTSVPLAVHVESKGSLGSTIVERAWISSHIGIGSRQDRAVYRFTTTESRFELTLPKQAVPNGVRVVLNENEVAAAVGPDRKLTVSLPKETARRPQVLEVSYRFADRDASLGNSTLEAPRLTDDVWVRRFYWQVHLPPHEHLMFTPVGFVSESTWRFNGILFGRQPLRSQADLESWSGATSEAADVAGNTYLFSSLGPVERLDLSTARRTWLVLGASLTALCLGLLMIYLPEARRALVLVLVAGLTSLGLLYPEPVVLLLEAGSLGAALVLLAGLLERVVAGRRSRVPPRRGASSVVDHRGMVFEKASLAAAGAHSSTRTAAMAVPAAGPETAP